jgi:hypothetical protein
MKIVILGAAVMLAAVALTGCGLNKISQPFNDAPRSDNEDHSAAQVITMPDGFSNLATKCVNGVRYTVAFHNDGAYGAISTVVDPKCGR